GWTYALKDYTEMNLTVRFDDPNMVLLQEQVDPFFYKERLTMPKMVVNAAMDEFQQPDDTHYWWSSMPGPKHFVIIPNAEHSLATGIIEAVPAIGAFVQALLHQDVVPTFVWDISADTGAITATLDEHGIVHEATMWYAVSCGMNAWDKQNRRDFRIAHLDQPCACGPSAEGMCVNLATFWQKETLEMTMVKGRRTYTASRPAPLDGTWTAFFIDVQYVNKHALPFDVKEVKEGMLQRDRGLIARIRALFPDFGGFPHDIRGFMEFTSEVSVWPNTFPYPDCSGMDCGATLV
ncbi:PhoPQ-activated pathogenicity-related protein-domain-containing protein, partial [Ochromonadaceae sp. CCMP2298]